MPMKKCFIFTSLLVLMVLAFLTSCSDDVLKSVRAEDESVESLDFFSFETVTAPENWSKYQTLKEMLKACEIPNDKLEQLSTEELIEICMSHPLRFIYYAYNNQMQGALVVINNFNGFQELKKREDAPQLLMSFYEDIFFNENAAVQRGVDFRGITYLGFIELFLASKQLPELYQGENITKLENLSNRVIDYKLSNPGTNYSDVKFNLLINAQIKLEKGIVSDEEKQLLEQFVNCCGDLNDPQQITEVSLILSK